MKILPLSDLHLEVNDHPHKLKLDTPSADLIILAGDIHKKEAGVDFANTLNKPVIYIAGNHEYYGGYWQKTLLKMKERAAGTQVHVLEKDTYIQDNIRFLCCTLWTDLRIMGSSVLGAMYVRSGMNDYHKIRDPLNNYSKLHPSTTEADHYKAKNWLITELNKPWAGKTVVVTHHAPSIRSVQDVFKLDPLTAGYASDLEGLIEDHDIDLWIHGHTHHPVDYELHGTRIISNPCGYMGSVPGYRPDLRIEL